MRPLPVVAGLLALPTLALASSLVPHTLRQRAEASDRVALVQVLSQRVEETKGAAVPIKTYTRVAVGRDLRGAGPAELTIVQLGGAVGSERLDLPGDAKFTVGETAVVFLRCRLAADRCHLVALGAGKLDVVGEAVLALDLFTGKWVKKSVGALESELTAVKR